MADEQFPALRAALDDVQQQLLVMAERTASLPVGLQAEAGDAARTIAAALAAIDTPTQLREWIEATPGVAVTVEEQVRVSVSASLNRAMHEPRSVQPTEPVPNNEQDRVVAQELARERKGIDACGHPPKSSTGPGHG